MARYKALAKEQLEAFPAYIVTTHEEVTKRLAERTTPVTLELGMGSGDMLVALAADYPGEEFVGLEMKEERCYKMAQKAVKAGVANCWSICAPGFAMYDVIAQHPVDTLWITFPDPWPKRHHRRNRFVTFQTVNTILGLLKPGGMLYFKTDHKELFEWTHMVLRHSDCEITFVTENLHQSDFPYQYMTAFERRYTEQKKPIYLLSARNGKDLP